MVRVEINKRDLANIESKLKSLANITNNLKPAFNEIGDYLVSETTQRFKDSTAPDGSKWGSVKRGDKPLINKGRLRDSINHQTTNDSVVIGTNLIYAVIHQFGGQAGRGRKMTITARPFLGINIQD